MKYYYRNNKLSLCNALYHARRQTDAWIRVWAAAFFFCSVFASNRFSAVIFPRILISSVDWNVEFKIIIGSSSISSPIGCRSHGAPFAGTLRRTFCFEMLLALLLLLLVGWLAWHSIAVCALPRYKKCAFILFSALHYYFVFFSLCSTFSRRMLRCKCLSSVCTRARALTLFHLIAISRKNFLVDTAVAPMASTWECVLGCARCRKTTTTVRAIEILAHQVSRTHTFCLCWCCASWCVVLP